MGWFDKPEPEVPDDDLKVVITAYDSSYVCRLYDGDFRVESKFTQTRWGARRVASRMLRDRRANGGRSEYREEIRA